MNAISKDESARPGAPKLFISFTGTLCALRSGQVGAADLDTGLFVFGCVRDHAITPGANGEYVEHDVRDRPDLHQQLVAALLKAETAGRVRWRALEQRNASFALVNELLVANGYKRLMADELYYTEAWMGRDYCYPAVVERSTELVVIGG